MATKTKSKYTSKGTHPAVRSSLSNAIRADRSVIDITLNLMKAYRDGRNPWITIDNPNPKETAKRKIRVKANTLWGMPKDRKAYTLPGTGDPADKKKKKANA